MFNDNLTVNTMKLENSETHALKSDVSNELPVIVDEISPNQSQHTESHLDILDNLESIFVKQEFEQVELITGFETRNKYGIFTSDGIEIFVAEEYSEFVRRICLGKYRSMDIRVEDKRGTEVLQIEREVPVYYCLFPFCCFHETSLCDDSDYIGCSHFIFVCFTYMNSSINCSISSIEYHVFGK